MRTKIFVLLTVLALLLGTVMPTLAQDAATGQPPVFCGDLSEEDCAILQDSREATNQVAQNTSLVTFDVTVMGLLELLLGLPAETINATLTSTMKSVADPAAMAGVQQLNGLSQEETVQLLADDPQPMLDLLNGWDFDASLSLAMTPELADLISMQSGLDFPDRVAMQAKMVDGVLYWDLSEIAAFVPTVASGWIGFPVAQMMAELEAQGAFDQAVEAMNDPSVAASAGATMAGMGSVQFFQQNAEMFQKFMTIERGEDVDLDGQAAATFVTNFDAAAFLSSPDFQQIVIDLANAGAFEGTGLTAADIEQNVQMLGMMGPMLFTGIAATATETIGLEDLYQYEYESALAWDMSGLVEMAVASGQLPAELQPTSDQIGFSVNTTISNDDMSTEATETIEAPVDAQMIPLETVLNESTAP
jgi:hypothetical protein